MNGQYVFKESEILNEMQCYHIEKTRQSFDTDCDLTVHLEQAKHRYCEDSILNCHITDKEIEHTFGTCSRTPGPDDITTLMLDNAERQTMVKCLSKLWNEVWITHIMPNKWKLEQRFLLPKAGKEHYNACNSYRTVSVTSILGKRLEKIMVRRLVYQTDLNGFDDNQFAYLQQCSSTQAVLMLADMIKSNMIQNKTTGALFFDYTEAFGSVTGTS